MLKMRKRYAILILAQNWRLNIEEIKYKIWISLIKNLGIKKYKLLIQKFGSREGIWNAKKEEINSIKGIGENISNIISNKLLKEDVERHLEFMIKNSIEIISIEDNEYPKILKKIYNPPISLYVRGNKSIFNMTSIGIVGCRDATDYGLKNAKEFAFNMSKKGFNVVSGLARGIDAYSHLGALMANGKTTAVLGNGLDFIYPEENVKIAQKILDCGGAIISEYPLGTKPDKMNFPARNRIISGLCTGILVIEAKEKSGSLITVDFALEQGRDVFAIPGNIDSEKSFGTNEIIKQGAKLVTSVDDILEDFF